MVRSSFSVLQKIFIPEIETESEVQDSDVGDVDPNAINVESEIADSPEESVVDADNLDGVVLPDQTLTDEEIAKIADESLKPIQPAGNQKKLSKRMRSVK